MRIFGLNITFAAPPAQTPRRPAALLTYTPEDRVLSAYADALIVMAHLARGFTGSRREMARTGMSNRRWKRATYMLTRSGIISIPRSGQALELTCYDMVRARQLLADTRQMYLRNLQNGNYLLPFD